jgi:hypothetical protein
MRANVPNIFEGHEWGFYVFFALIAVMVVGVLVIVFLVLSYLFRTFYPKPKLAHGMAIDGLRAAKDEKSST